MLHAIPSILIESDRSGPLELRVFTGLDEACISLLDRLSPPTLFLRKEYFESVSQSMEDHLENLFLFYLQDGLPVGLVYGQLFSFSAVHSIRSFREKTGEHSLGRKMRSLLARHISFKTLVMGNLLLTGNYGFHFSREFAGDIQSLLKQSGEMILHKLRREISDIRMLVMKDAHAGDPVEPEYCPGPYFGFQVLPNMILPLYDHWKSFEDYLTDMKSKYRVRLLQARKKGNNITSRFLSSTELENRQQEIQSLLNQVVKDSNFRLVEVNSRYLINLKLNLPDHFFMLGYEDENKKLVGFMGFFLDGGNLVAHFTGFDPTINKRMDLYLNMLLDLVKQGIQSRCRCINFSRTAMEIKSSVGAVPVPMSNYLIHGSKAVQMMVPHLFSLLYEPEGWKQRHPFREQSLTGVV